MKKLLLITLVLLIAGPLQLFPANPIPSYDLKMTYRANFQEKHFGQTGNQNGKEKRQMNIETSTSTATPPPSTGMGRAVVVAMLYKLDGSASMGPYYIGVGQSLSIGIDGSAWGVNIAAPDAALVSVWTTN